MNPRTIQQRVQPAGKVQPAAVVANAPQAQLQPAPNMRAQRGPDLIRAQRYEHPRSPVMQALQRAQALRSLQPPKGSGT
jgi:hypothetical protein